MRTLNVSPESWPLARPFVISRGVKTAAEVVVVEVVDGAHVGRGECVPYGRYGESMGRVVKEIERLSPRLEAGLTREELGDVLPPGAARAAVDCALWDLAAKQAGRRVWDLAGVAEPEPIVTAETISIGSTEEMGEAAARLCGAPLIKVKLDAERVIERIAIVREKAPKAQLIADPNEGWSVDLLVSVAGTLADLGVTMIEQPVPTGADGGLLGLDLPVTLCADEACHTTADLAALKGKYQMVNIKLDKAGGLTQALKLAEAAKAQGFDIMIGCMVATSLAIAPAMVLASYASYVDLDGPLLLAKDRQPSLQFDDGRIYPPAAGAWG